MGYNKHILIEMIIVDKEDFIHMGTVIILGVMVAFLAAIFTSGYVDKPGTGK